MISSTVRSFASCFRFATHAHSAPRVLFRGNPWYSEYSGTVLGRLFATRLSAMSATSSAMSPAASSSGEGLSFRLQPDGRQVLTRKRARELLAPLSTAPFTSISLGGCALGDAAAGVAGPALVALANKQCVRSVTFADCIASLPQDEAIRSLTTLSSSWYVEGLAFS